jgi:hypothetical protein
MELPRYLVSNRDQGDAFVRILTGTGPTRKRGYP